MDKLGAHLKQVDEGYFQHMGHALSFALNLALAFCLCLIHAFLPFLFEKQGSAIVTRLYDRMVVNRKNLSRSKQQDTATDCQSAG